MLRYGDVAVFPWGDKERFEAGAFGDVSQLDLILNLQHDRGIEIARTGGGGLTVTDSPMQLDIRADLDREDPDALRTLRKVKNNILRGLSVEFMPLKHRLEPGGDGSYTVVHEQAELRGAGVVDRPQYKQSTLRAEIDALRQQTEESKGMEDKEVRALVDEILAKREVPVPDLSGISTMLDEAMKRFAAEQLPEAINATIAKREEEAAEKAAEAERMGDNPFGKKKKPKDMAEDDDDDDDKDKMPKDMAEKFDVEVRQRADLMIQVGPLMPKDYDFAGKTRHEILVAAAGDEVVDAANRSDDYLHAKVEGIIERRKNAGQFNERQTQQNANTGGGNQGAGISSPVSVHSVVVARNAATAKAQTATEK